jgi:predicted nucleic acid-binding protein
MERKRLRAFLDSNVLLAAIRGEQGARRLFSPEAEQYATYVVNPVVLQELLLASAAAEGKVDLDELTKHFEVISADVLSDPGVLAYVRQLRNRVAHTNDLLILGSARTCDILLTYDQGLLTLGDFAEVATATPEQFLEGLQVRR